jgi:hypothetical protein
MRRLLRTLWGIIGIAFAAFSLLNLAAWADLSRRPPDADEHGLFIHRNSPRGVAIRSRLFGTDDRGLLEAYGASPGIRPHTVLHFAEGEARPHYSVGVEGMRYPPGWTDAEARSLLETGGSVFVFGGSTTFGHGVPDGDTVVAQLDRLDPDRAWINFAAQAHDSIREVDKLLHLLRKGIRPRRVVFIDGLNDITTFARSPYAIHDSPRAQGLVLDRGEVPLVFGYPRRENMLLALAYSMPLTHWWTARTSSEVPEDAKRRSGGHLESRVDWQRLMRFHYDWASIHAGRTDALAADVVRYYGDAIAFVRDLGRAFGFSATFVYQPIGLLEVDQPFISDDFRESDQYAVFRDVDAAIRDAIASGRLAMRDCSRSIAASGVADGYVDATHYSPSGGAALAGCIFAEAAGPR